KHDEVGSSGLSGVGEPWLRVSTYPLIDADVAAALVLEHTPTLGLESVVLADAASRVLGEDLVADAPLPSFPSSAVDGYAVRAAEIGIAAATGRARLRVFRRPRVALMSTGDELVEVGETPRRGQIPDSNRWALLAALRDARADVHMLGIAPDEPDALRRLVTGALKDADALVTSGGVSVGTHDLVKPLLESLGTVHIGRVKLKPGKPFTFATLPSPLAGEGGPTPPDSWGGGPQGLRGGGRPDGDTKVAFGLPGFPVSSLVTFEVFVRPALRKMQGFAQLHRPTLPVRLGYDARSTPDRTEYQRVTLRREGRELIAETTGSQAS